MPDFGDNRHREHLLAKHARVWEPHVAPINHLANRIADAEGIPRGHVPYVDPDLGGIHARVLVLLDNPSRKAKAGTGSGLLSLDNDDRTAWTCRLAYKEAGVDWRSVVHWNSCPFPTASKGPRSLDSERARAARWTRELVTLCSNLEFVLLLGGPARDGWRRAGRPSSLVVIGQGRDIPHCSGQGIATADAKKRFYGAIAELAGRLRNGGNARRNADVFQD
ncbi:uracil-DNA glycosylase [Rhodococcus sp. ZPP]|uniref:uracil-DNA glycosylase n=1 Tax=Rhodococcus sp. ZPP TaxID=2749906 RepID=UPI001AD86CD6|nr:uracil-DNA glycosylase [Rhodococcus sp. ZPP]QTJ65233.1 uracil-DNA glycosylase [Rhodococcus sp. ZPP]